MKKIRNITIVVIAITSLSAVGSEKSDLQQASMETKVSAEKQTANLEQCKKYIRSKNADAFEQRIKTSCLPKEDLTRLLFIAVHYDTPHIIKQLIIAGADVNGEHEKNKYTPLCSAAEKCHTMSAEALIINGANVNKKTSENKTALLMAWIQLTGTDTPDQDYFDMITLLAQHGADENAIVRGNRCVRDYAKTENLEKEFNEALLKGRKLYIE